MSKWIYFQAQVAQWWKNLLANAGNTRDVDSILGSGRSPGGGATGSSFLTPIISMDTGAWWTAYSPWGLKESDTAKQVLWETQGSCSGTTKLGDVSLSDRNINKNWHLCIPLVFQTWPKHLGCKEEEKTPESQPQWRDRHKNLHRQSCPQIYSISLNGYIQSLSMRFFFFFNSSCLWLPNPNSHLHHDGDKSLGSVFHSLFNILPPHTGHILFIYLYFLSVLVK